MLIEFRVENFRSIRDEQVLSLEAAPGGDPSDPRPRLVEGHDKPLLPAVALYGANASGKSNVLKAFDFYFETIDRSHRSWEPTGGVPRDPFALSLMREKPSLFEAVFLIDGKHFQYGFLVNDSVILEEWLRVGRDGELRTLFERDYDQFTFAADFRGENSIIQRLTRSNSLFLSAAIQNNHPELKRFAVFFESMRVLRVGELRSDAERKFIMQWAVGRMLTEGPAFIHQSQRNRFASFFSGGNVFLQFVRQADPSIQEIKAFKREGADWARDFDEILNSEYSFSVRHQFRDGSIVLPLERESNGTQTLFWMTLLFLEVLAKGGVLFVDELESSLHPNLARFILDLFLSRETNFRNAQLVFTTHDTNLLGYAVGEPVLRRDQVWFTEKDEGGGTVLYPLTDFKPQDPENLERGYLQGRYGAIPFLGGLETTGGGPDASTRP